MDGRGQLRSGDISNDKFLRSMQVWLITLLKEGSRILKVLIRDIKFFSPLGNEVGIYLHLVGGLCPLNMANRYALRPRGPQGTVSFSGPRLGIGVFGFLFPGPSNGYLLELILDGLP